MNSPALLGTADDHAVKTVLEHAGRIDVVVNNAGIALIGSLEETSISSLRRDQITQVGIDLDRKLATLLTVLNIEVPAILSDAQNAAPTVTK